MSYSQRNSRHSNFEFFYIICGSRLSSEENESLCFIYAIYEKYEKYEKRIRNMKKG